MGGHGGRFVMAYLTIAPLVLVRVPVGGEYRVDYHYQDSVIPKLTDEQAEHFLAQGLVEQIDDVVVDDGKPKHTAPKAEWVDYVVLSTANSDAPVSREEAEATSKADLVALYG